ncbi:MAG TPA: hypothetical protein VNZ49_16165, partial [Bacteroidia bacterium]|nr:hypothetical protein [Bacteroidia bacterium]
TSMAISVKKYATASTFTIALNDQNIVHIATVSGNTTFNIPDATICPGRILIFTFDPAVTGGNFIITTCCGQTINGLATATFSYVSGVAKPSIGIVSDGTNWQIIFKN